MAMFSAASIILGVRQHYFFGDAILHFSLDTFGC